ncbi:MAG: glycosyltransferase family 4 protein [Bacteroidales bacterium]|nr:glycosyltransferase family 4 protein [Bacteroidales bacterium]
MKVVLVNTTDSGGGAAIACKRLMEALALEGVDVKMLVMTKRGRLKNVHAFKDGKSAKYFSLFRFLYERLSFIVREKDKSVRFAFSPANIGVDISAHPLVKEADIVHLHWVNGGFISLGSLKRLLEKKNNLIWTLHDMWLFTGGCHYSGECRKFEESCHHCPFLNSPAENDLSNSIWLRKAGFLKNSSLNIVTCSEWLAKTAKQSSLLRQSNVRAIPNPISLTQFKPVDKISIRKKLNIPINKFVLLFGAANIQDKRKGFVFLVDALNKLKKMGIDDNQMCVVVFGKAKNFKSDLLPFSVVNLGQITSLDEMANVYAMADMFVLPSLEDNLPNTVMESMACGTPVIAFNIGGIPEMVSHESTGLIVDEISSDALAESINCALNHPRFSEWGKMARLKTETMFNQKTVALQYMNIYNSILK